MRWDKGRVKVGSSGKEGRLFCDRGSTRTVSSSQDVYQRCLLSTRGTGSVVKEALGDVKGPHTNPSIPVPQFGGVP